ncbi:MAG: alpha/beta fold hydrolase [Planctomycetota bacterium]
MSQSLQRRTILCATLLGVYTLTNHASADDLRRRGMMGVQLAPVTEETKTTLKLDSVKGVLVTGVVPDSAAAAAGAQPNDVIRKIGSDSIDELPSLFAAMRKYYGGDTLSMTLIREGAEKTLELTLKPRPTPSHSQFELVYDSAGEPGHRVRTFVAKPASEGKHPAVLIITGIPGPQSIESPTPDAHPMISLIYRLTQAGYVTMRVERPGVGDSEGVDLQATTVAADVASFRAALAKLRSYDFVDENKVYVFSHSLGAALAPMVAADQKIAGIVTFAGFYRPWPAGLVDSMQRQWKLELVPDDERKTKETALKGFLDQYLTKKEKPSDILAKTPDLAQMLGRGVIDRDFVVGMPAKYGQELAEFNGPTAWSSVRVPVLAIWGESDYIADKSDSQQIVDSVNKSQPGKGKFISMPETDHMMGKAVDQEESYLSGQGLMDPKFVETITKWMSEQPGQGS